MCMSVQRELSSLILKEKDDVPPLPLLNQCLWPLFVSQQNLTLWSYSFCSLYFFIFKRILLTLSLNSSMTIIKSRSKSFFLTFLLFFFFYWFQCGHFYVVIDSLLFSHYNWDVLVSCGNHVKQRTQRMSHSCPFSVMNSRPIKVHRADYTLKLLDLLGNGVLSLKIA